jgi:hypothetical protein
MAYDEPYGGEQEVGGVIGEYILDGIFRLPFFRIIVDDVIDGNICFRLMEGAEAHYFVLGGGDNVATFDRQTSIGYDSFTFTLVE